MENKALRNSLQDVLCLAEKLEDAISEFKKNLVFSLGFTPFSDVEVYWGERQGLVVRYGDKTMSADEAIYYMEAQGFISAYDF